MARDCGATEHAGASVRSSLPLQSGRASTKLLGGEFYSIHVSFSMSGVQGCANIGDYVGFHAAERPKAIALIQSGREISYGEVDRDLAKFTSAVRQFALEPGSRVAVGCEAVYVHWLLLAA